MPSPCDLFIAHGRVVTMDDARTIIEDGAVALARGEIVAVGTSSELGARFVPRRALDAEGGIVLPGMVNLHTHLAMTVFRGAADDLSLEGFLAALWPLEQRLSAQVVRIGVTAGIVESLLSGVTTALDMYFYPEEGIPVADALGFRLVTGPVFVGANGAAFTRSQGFDEELARASAWLDSYADAGLGLRRSLGPHSTYVLSQDQIAAVVELASARNAVVHVHASESAAEVEVVLRARGARPLEVLESASALGSGTVVAHAVALEQHEQEMLAATGTAVAHCPVSNLKLASGIAPVAELRARGVPVGIGTDGPASSNDLGVLPAARLAALLQKHRVKDAQAMPARDAIAMATIDGARSLGLGHLIGSIEAGKRADIVVMSAAGISAAPLHCPYSSLLYSLGKSDVRHVLVDGRLVVEDGQVTGADETEVARELSATARQLLAGR
ncbi:MAG: amidohydrolase family protein [Acidimicrobiales bacterium]